MNINFTARHYKSSPRLREYAENEVKKLEKYYDGIVDCKIILDYQKELQIAEIIIGVHNSKLTVIEKTDDIYKSVDSAVGKLERQLKKYKQKNFQQFEKKDIKHTESLI
jgi:putative sigma-54 modulation protein